MNSDSELKRKILLRYRDQLNWEKVAEPVKVPPRWLILPPWSKQKIGKGEMGIYIKPSIAFGNGQHISTQLLLDIMPKIFAENFTRPPTVLDLGCGSGILALASVKLGAKKVDGMDIDLKSLRVARENAKLNKANIHFSRRLSFKKMYDLVLANLYGDLQPIYSPYVRSILRPGGVILLSGMDMLKPSQIKNILRSYTSEGYRTIHKCENELVCCGLKSPPAS